MVLVVELTLADGQVIGLEAGDQITINALGEEYSGCWFCLSKTSNSAYVRKFFASAPKPAASTESRDAMRSIKAPVPPAQAPFIR